MASVEELLVILRANTSDFSSKFGAAEKQVAGFGATTSSGLSKFAAIGGVALGAVAIGAVAVGVASVKAADDFEQSHARLENAVKKIGSSWDAESGKVSDLNSKMEKLGFTNSDTENSLSRLVLATGNVSQSTKLMGLAADIARARNISLQSATDLLVKVEGQRYIGLSKTLGVSKEVIAGFHSQADAVKFLTDRFGGSAQKNADTFAGKMQVLDAQLTDTAKNIGEVLIPVLESLAGGFADVVNFFKQNEVVAKALGIAIAAVLVPAMATFIALKIGSAVSAIGTAFATAVNTVLSYAAALVATIPEAGALIAANLGLAASEDAVAVSAGAAALALAAGLGIAGVLVGAIIGVGYAFGYFDDSLKNVDTSAKSLASDSVPKLAGQMKGLQDSVTSQVKALKETNAEFDDSKVKADAYKQVMKDFNTVLSDSPQFAGKFIDAMKQAGLSTDDAQKKLDAHKDALKRNADQSLVAAQTTRAFNDSLHGTNTAMAAVVKPLDDAGKAQLQYNDAVFASINAGFAAEDAQRKLGDAMKETVKSGTDAAQVNEDQRQAIVALVTATGDQAKALTAGLGPAAQAAASSSAQLGELQKLKAEYPQMGPVIDGYIKSLQDSTTGAGGASAANAALTTSLETFAATAPPKIKAACLQIVGYLQSQASATSGANIQSGALLTALETFAATAPPKVKAAAEQIIAYLQGIQSPPPIVITADNSRALAAINATRQAIISLPGQVSVNTPVPAGGGVKRFALGGLVPGNRGQAVPITAHAGEYVLSTDIVDRIKRGAPSSGARVDVNAAATVGGTTSVRGGDTYQVTINAMSQNPQDVVDAFARYIRSNGNGGIKKLVGV